QPEHRVGVTGFFCALLGPARQRDDAELRAWSSERRCGATWGEVVRPDRYGLWAEGGREVAFLLEYDLGTETQARLTASSTATPPSPPPRAIRSGSCSRPMARSGRQPQGAPWPGS